MFNTKTPFKELFYLSTSEYIKMNESGPSVLCSVHMPGEQKWHYQILIRRENGYLQGESWWWFYQLL